MTDDHESESHDTGAQPRSRTPSHGRGKITPFVEGDPRAARGRQKAIAVKREQAIARRTNVTDLRSLIDEAIAAHPREQLGPLCVAAASTIAGQVLSGDIKIRHAQDAAELLRTLADVARLESGMPTSASVVAHLSNEQMVERIGRLQQQVREAQAGSHVGRGWDHGGATGSLGSPAPEGA